VDRPTERGLGINNPILLCERFQQCGERFRCRQWRTFTIKMELLIALGLPKYFKKAVAKDLAQNFHRQKEAPLRRDPPAMIRGQAAARHDAMNMRMPPQGLSPGVQYAKEPDLDPESLGIGGHLHESRRDRLEKPGKHESSVLPDDRDQAMRQAENDVEVLDREKFLLSVTEPFLTCVDLTLGAVPVPAAVKNDLFVTTTGAPIAMSAQSGRTAVHDGAEYFDLRPAQCPADAVPELTARHANDIGHLPEGPCH
jgi:hypothetical protein